MTPKELEQLVGGEVAKIGQGRAFKNKWIAKESNGLVRLVSQVLCQIMTFINLL